MNEPKTPSEEYMRAVAAQTDFTPCERTIRMCIEALPDITGASINQHAEGYDFGIRTARNCLKALLPDPVKVLVDEYENAMRQVDRPAAMEFARWLIDTGTIKPTSTGNHNSEGE